MNNLIGISGKINSGKDLTGKIIKYLTVCQDRKERGKEILPFNSDWEWSSTYWEIKKYADKLKDIICLLIGCTRTDLEDINFKNKELGEEWWLYNLKAPNGEYYAINVSKNDLKLYTTDISPNYDIIKLTPRKLLQLLGTDCGRDIIHPNLWCISLFADYTGDTEEWKDIKNYEGKYQISSFGRVKSLGRKSVYGDNKGDYHTVKEKILQPTITGKYYMIKLEGNNSRTIHSLVAETFLSSPDNSNLVINHIDQNPLNNFVKNLEWVTQSENLRQANLLGNGNIGTKQVDSKLNDEQVLEIKKYLKNKTYNQITLAKMYNVGATTISDIKLGKKWKHIGKERITVDPIIPKPLPNWIVTDVRFPNEAKAIKDRGGIVIRVNRDIINGILIHKGNVEHESETALDNYTEFDHVIDNNGTIEDLIEKIKLIL